ncbi:tetratricopeptide repeat protein [Novosphingobium umbonatum]|uniref:Tetratricopeptide repeat protein n=2 Tax=Novosphingobium umbonatum TaxID=1908524 RepID=A0A437NCS7_9SPHN|nr:tetratricopeptide repeat protein [Novosphingobium umbonatum]
MRPEMNPKGHMAKRRQSAGWRRNILLAACLSAAWMGAPSVSAQTVNAEAQDPNKVLAAALARLGRNSRDIEALQMAGDAGLALGDVQAAIGFLSRADRLSPYNPNVMASLASARLRAQDPVTAIGLFEDAAKAGSLNGEQIADRGLAYDLVSDNVTAQHYYREALAAGAGDEAVRRLALSLAIMGDRKAVETVLAPLLQKQDRSAWRIRAFSYAILGREEEAVSIVNSTMPAEMASAMAPYLRYMRKLTPAQQAAAANLGFFPQPSQVGQENARIADWVASHGLRRPASADLALVPQGEALGSRANAAPPEPKPSRSTSAAVPVELAAATPVRSPAASRQSEPKSDAGRPEPTRQVGTAAVVSSFDLARVAPAVSAPAPQREVQAPQPEPAPRIEAKLEPALVLRSQPVVQPLPKAEPKPEPKPAPKVEHKVEPKAPAKKPSFTQLFEEFGKVAAAPAPASGAVDIRKIAAPRPTPKAPPPPPPPKHPSRIWVQVGIGKENSRILFDWRKNEKAEPALFKGHTPHISDWGRTNRVLVGPFDTEAAAKAYNDKLHKAGFADSHVWLSSEGQVVDSIGEP